MLALFAALVGAQFVASLLDAVRCRDSSKASAKEALGQPKGPKSGCSFFIYMAFCLCGRDTNLISKWALQKDKGTDYRLASQRISLYS